MNPPRRRFLVLLAGLAYSAVARAGDWAAISVEEATQALRDSLRRSIGAAIDRLGREDGYYGNPGIRIGLPKNFAKAERYLRALGFGKQVDDLVLASNRAAEAAVPQAREMVLEELRKIGVVDAKAILSGGDGAATEWFRKNTEANLRARLAPIIHAVAEQSDLVRSYDALSSNLVRLAGIKSELATVEDYVSRKALHGFYTLIAEEEHAIRTQPLDSAGSVIGKVFGQSHRVPPQLHP
jgi:hypothetical protein